MLTRAAFCSDLNQRRQTSIPIPNKPRNAQNIQYKTAPRASAPILFCTIALAMQLAHHVVSHTGILLSLKIQFHFQSKYQTINPDDMQAQLMLHLLILQKF